MNTLQRFQYFLWLFGHFKVPLIGHLRSKLISLNDQEIVVKIPLKRRSKNHLNSMYFGALAVGADIAGGLHSFYFSKMLKLKVSVVFKSFEAQFLRRAESDVYFICMDGEKVKAMIIESQETKKRVNSFVKINAYTNYPDNKEAIADFILELSVKVLASST